MERKHYRVPDNPSEGPYLVGSECTSCRTVFFPWKRLCPVCAKDGTIAEKVLSRRGKIYSFSYCTVAPPGVKAPYIVGLVDLPEGPRITSIIVVENPSPTSVSIGDEVEITVGKVGEDEEGRGIINYMFKPAKKEESTDWGGY